MLRMRRTVSLSISMLKANVICCAIRGQPQLGLRLFMSTIASMRSLFGPFRPGLLLRLGENRRRYFRFFRAWWKFRRVEGFSTIADRRTRARRIRSAHKPAIIRSDARRLGARFRERLRISS
jgi:hypothetical protein